MGIRGKLFITSLLLMLVAGVATFAVLDQWLGGFLRARVAEDLESRVHMARALVESAARLRDASDGDPLADRLGQAAGARVTIFASDGRILGDSRLGARELGSETRYADLPEVRAAMSLSPSVVPTPVERRGHLYLAARYVRPEGSGTVRVALSTTDVERVLVRLRFFVLLTGLAGVGIAVLMSGLASFWASRELVALVDSASAVAAGGKPRLAVEGDSENELGSLAGSFNRIADRLERAVAELGGERDRFEAILGHMGEAVIALDADDHVQLVNRAARDLLEVDDLRTGQPVVELVRAPAFADLLPRVRANGKASAELTVGKTQQRQVLARAAHLEASGGVVIVMLDVTDMRKLEAVRRDFVANVSHELRTPISIIRANAETLLDGALTDPDRGPGFAHAIMRSAERLGRIVADLLDLARIESGKLPVELEPLPLGEVADRVVDSLKVQARARSIGLESTITDELEALCDEDVLEQILTNLVDNAVKYTPAGGHVQVRALRDGERVRIEVADDGPGIESRHRQRVFERFYRVDPGRSRDLGGTGLGLSIVRHLAEAMGGNVDVVENDPQGSIFRVWLRSAPREPVVEAVA